MTGCDAVITVCAGTAEPAELRRSFSRLHAAVSARFPDALHMPAIAGGRMRAVLQSRAGGPFFSPEQALERCRRCGARRVLVVGLFLADGVLYGQTEAACAAWRERFDELTLTPPLLRGQAGALAERLDALYPSAADRGYVLLGHGSGARAQDEFHALQNELERLGRPDLRIALLKGEMHVQSAGRALLEMGLHSVSLAFLMLSAGYHAAQELRAPQGAKALLEALGLAVSAEPTPFVRLPGLETLFLAAADQ